MEPNFLDGECNVFMKGSEIRPKETIEGERSKEIPRFELENDDTMQLIIKQLHEQKLKCKPHGKNFQLGLFFCVNDESPINV
jgi:hypothetical protein